MVKTDAKSTTKNTSRSNSNTRTQNDIFLLNHDKILGVGSTGKVLLATHKPTGTRVAAKMVSLLTYREEFVRELELLRQLDHPNIVKFYDWKVTNDQKMGILFLHKFKKTLEDHLEGVGSLGEVEMVDVMFHLTDALYYMHGLGIVHYDIKTENIAYNESNKKVQFFDFGHGLQVLPGSLVCFDRGSPLYMGPERLVQRPHDPFKADLWSLGVTFFEIATGTTPFDDCDSLELLYKRMENIDNLDIPSNIPSGVAKVIRGLLRWDPDERLSLEKVKIFLRDHEN